MDHHNLDPEILYNNITNLIGIFGSMVDCDCVFFMISRGDPNYNFYKSQNAIIPMSNKNDIESKDSMYNLFHDFLLKNFEFDKNYIVKTSIIHDNFKMYGTKVDTKIIAKLMLMFSNNFPHLNIMKHRYNNIRSYIGLRLKGSNEFINFRNKSINDGLKLHIDNQENSLKSAKEKITTHDQYHESLDIKIKPKNQVETIQHQNSNSFYQPNPNTVDEKYIKQSHNQQLTTEENIMSSFNELTNNSDDNFPIKQSTLSIIDDVRTEPSNTNIPSNYNENNILVLMNNGNDDNPVIDNNKPTLNSPKHKEIFLNNDNQPPMIRLSIKKPHTQHVDINSTSTPPKPTNTRPSKIRPTKTPTTSSNKPTRVAVRAEDIRPPRAPQLLLPKIGRKNET